MASITGTSGNDSLVGTSTADYIFGDGLGSGTGFTKIADMWYVTGATATSLELSGNLIVT